MAGQKGETLNGLRKCWEFLRQCQLYQQPAKLPFHLQFHLKLKLKKSIGPIAREILTMFTFEAKEEHGRRGGEEIPPLPKPVSCGMRMVYGVWRMVIHIIV